MTATGDIKVGALVTFQVRVNDTLIPDELNVYSITIEQFINKIPLARITVLDGDPSTGRFTASSSSSFVPGGVLTIEAGYDFNYATIFKGIITQQSIRIDDAIGASLEVECRDAAIRMTIGRKSTSFSNKKDSDIMSAIINSYPGLSAAVSSTETTWQQQVQYYTTDWDFIMSRAELNGMIVSVVNGKITVASPDSNTKPVFEADYGDNIYELSADLNSVTQINKVVASAWDFKNQQINTMQVSASLEGPGNISSEKLSSVVGPGNYLLQTPAAVENEDLSGWCKAQLTKSAYSKIQGEVKIDGNAVLQPGNYISLGKIGDRFSGDHFVSGVTHTLSSGNWFCDVNFGMPSTWFAELPDVVAPPASGILPGVRGLFQGIVKKMFEDPDGQFRILVTVPLFDNAGQGLWARLTNFYSTNGAGVFFLPEVGDEVILGFLNEDPRYPVILGSVYSNSKIKPYKNLQPDEKNQFKAIVSKSGIYIQFDDVDKILTITTPSENKIILDDKAKQVSLVDENENSIVLSQDGITIKSPKNINIEAEQKISMKGNLGISSQASGGDIQVSGLNIKENADVQYSAQSGAEMSMKSAIIMIN